MSLFEIIYWLAMLVEIIIRVPINKQRKAQKMKSQQVSFQEQALLFLLLAGMFILPALYSASSWLDFANYTLPAWANWLGVMIIILALIVFWRSHADLGLNWSPTLEIREKHELITRGIYGQIRHPMYASQWLWIIAQALLLPNWLAGVLGGLVFVPFYFLRVRAEEKLMLDSFGDEYAVYMKKTGAVFPKLGK
jgi:protein-S-isoprenylcysteine O-methyltransferase Ste14